MYALQVAMCFGNSLAVRCALAFQSAARFGLMSSVALMWDAAGGSTCSLCSPGTYSLSTGLCLVCSMSYVVHFGLNEHRERAVKKMTLLDIEG